ncbi:MAG: sel1 repeat family protein [Phycisphaerales bacterium]|nr:sel1 repeat family protein [Phycisphaerales bacterium]
MGDFAFNTAVHWSTKADLLRTSPGGSVFAERTGALHDNARATVEALHIDAYLTLTQQSGERFIPRLEYLAEQGSGHAAHTLGLIYTDTLGPRRDTAAAMRWFRKAARARNPEGLYRVSYNAHSNAVSDHSPRADTLLRGAVAYGHPAAAYTLGAPMVHSLIREDRTRGEALLLYAARMGITTAMVVLAEALARYELDHTDEQVADRSVQRRRWLQAAVRRGHTSAMTALAADILSDDQNTDEYARALELLNHASLRGDPDARLVRAKARWLGRGITQNRAKALRIVIRLSGDAHPESIRFLSYVAGDFTAQAHHAPAIAALRSLADRGNEHAKGHLGRLLIEGSGVSKDEQQGVNLLKQAVRAGNFEALEYLWVYARTRSDREAIFDEIRTYIDRGSTLRVPGAMYLRAYLLERQTESVESPEARTQINREIDNLLENAAIRGMPNAALTRARRALDAAPNSPDLPFVFSLRRHAARLDHPEGMHALAWALRRGNGAPADPKAARSWFEKAMQAGHAPSAHELGEMVWLGEGAIPDPVSAENLFSRAVQLGDIDAQVTHAMLLVHRGGEEDFKRAGELLVEAAQAGSIPAMIEYALLHMRSRVGFNDLDAAEFWLKKAMRDEPWAQTLLAMLNIEVRQHPAAVHEGLTHFFEAADRGSATALFTLARYYLSGTFVAQSQAIAESFLERAVEKNHPPSCKLLAELLLRDGPDRQRDDRAVKLLNIGLDAGDAECAAKLGELYASGRGVPRDLSRAFQLNLFAAERDHVEAMLSVALCYTHGRGVPTNPDAAKEWLRKAAAAGNPQARKLLGLPEEPSQMISNR